MEQRMGMLKQLGTLVLVPLDFLKDVTEIR
jgi:hypothetical protein